SLWARWSWRMSLRASCFLNRCIGRSPSSPDIPIIAATKIECCRQASRLGGFLYSATGTRARDMCTSVVLHEFTSFLAAQVVVERLGELVGRDKITIPLVVSRQDFFLLQLIHSLSGSDTFLHDG